MKKKAFTLIELLVVVSIIITVSTSWVFYFSDFIDNQELKQKLSLIEEDFNMLDKEVVAYNIFDYEISLNTNSGSLWYIVHKNKFDLKKSAQVFFDSHTWSWAISIENGVIWDTWQLQIESLSKNTFNKIISWNEIQTALI